MSPRLIVAATVLFLSTIALAQNLPGFDEGISPYGSYHGGDIDSISTSNGTLAINIPLISYPQRGGKLNLGFSVVYHNPIYTLTENFSNGRCALECFTWGITRNSLAMTLNLPSFNYKSPGYGITLVNGLYEPDGAVHRLVPTTSGNYASIDTTGYSYVPSAYVVRDRQGNRYIYTPSNSTPVALTQIEDVNGNVITGNTDPHNNLSVLSYTDTLGRTIPNAGTSTSTSSCPSGTYPNASASLYSTPGPNGTPDSFIVCYAKFPLNYTPASEPSICSSQTCYGLTGFVTEPQSIVLPNGTAWIFAFDNAGRLSQITLPTGGTISYTWLENSYCFVNGGFTLWQLSGAVATRTVNANDGTGSHQWSYDYTPGTQTVVTDPNVNDVAYKFVNLGQLRGGVPSCSLYESERDVYSGSHTSGTLLRKTVTSYQSTYDSNDNIAFNVVPTSVTTTDVLAGRASKVTKGWDSGVALTGTGFSGQNALYGDLLSQSEYDFTGTSPLRTTTYAYMALTSPNASSYLANNLLDLPYTVTVSGTSGQAAYTTYGYDETGLQTSNVTEQKTTGESHPGNQTSVHRWLNGSTTATTTCNVSVSNGYLVSNNVFYDTGMVQQSTDPCSFPTTYQYSGTYYGAFPTTVTNALGQSTKYGYDFNSGSVTSIVDPNQQPTSKTYDDMNRLTGISYPDGGSTAYCYTDGVANTCGLSGTSFSVVETKAIASSPAVNEISTVQVDGLGRFSQTELSTDPGGIDYTLTTYDALGRTSQRYNPTRCSPITTNCGTPIWGYTTTNYDALNRVTSVVEQDGSKVTYAYDQINAKNTGLCSTVTDEAGSSRQSCVDGLGRPTGVWENPSGLNYETDYTYDALSNLTNVNQKGSNSANARIRTFIYDSLSRLSSATNPESGQILYAYDADGNVIVKTAPLPNQIGTSTVTTTRTYDKLNRVTNTVYSDMTTPSTFYLYDVMPGGTANLTNIIGRVVTSGNQYAGGTSGKATANYYSYDAMGRVIRNWQQTPSVSPNGAWACTSYDLAGNVASITPPRQVMAGNATGCDPTGVTISYTHDGANRIATVTSSLSDAQHPAALYSVDPIYGYWAQGGLRKAYFGNSLTESHAYNNRLQPCRASVNTTSAFLAFCTDGTPAGNLLDFTVGYNAGSSDNGNVASWSAVGNQTFTRSYTYDALNRLNGMSDSATNQPCQGMSVTVDAWGNMTNETGTKGTCYNFSSAVGTNNQLQTGYQYDAAGNMTYDGTNSYTYDAESRVTQVNGGSTLSDIYDEYGKRARKTTGSAFIEYYYAPDGNVQIEYNGNNWPTQYVYAAGRLIAEYTSSAQYNNGTTEFIHADHLGSTRLVTGVNQSVIDSIDYNPFGQLIAGGSSTTHLFTGKERDEALLTDFDARYYRPLMGRFMTPDDGSDQHPSDPESWNLYSYVRNNPLSDTDPTGRCTYSNGKYMPDDVSDCSEVEDKTVPPTITVTATPPSTFETWADNTEWFANYALEQTVGNWLGSFMQMGRTKDPLIFGLSAVALINPIGGGGTAESEVESVAERIASGHALSKHASELGVASKSELKALVKGIIENADTANDVKELSGGRVAFWDDAKKAVVIFDPNSVDKGTVFVPRDGRAYFDSPRLK